MTAVIFFFLSAGLAVLLIWAAKAEDSALAQSIRRVVGISEPLRESVAVPVPLPLPLVVEETPAVEPEPPIIPEPVQLPAITFRDIASRRALWPDTLQLKLSKRVYIRFNGNVYGYMQFLSGMVLKVDTLSPQGEIFGTVDGNYLNLAVDETNFEEWFRAAYRDRYELMPVETERSRPGAQARHRVGTPQGDAAFWAEMRIWCDRNYGSISLEIKEDTLVFRWLPKEDVPVDFVMEAREIARMFLLKRSVLGSNENYAACEIRHPVTGELLGASSVFIPRL